MWRQTTCLPIRDKIRCTPLRFTQYKDNSIRYMKHHYWRKKGVIVPTRLTTSRYRIAISNKKTPSPYLYIASYIGVAARSEEARRAELG